MIPFHDKNHAPASLSRSLTLRFTALLFMFLVLLGGTYLAAGSALAAKEHDSLVGNLAGRQRMLTQKFARETNQALFATAISDSEMSVEMIEAASKTAVLYEMTLRAFLNGGEAETRDHGRIAVPQIHDETIVEHLRHVEISWTELREYAEHALASGIRPPHSSAAIRLINDQATKTTDEMDHVVTLLQEQSEAKLRLVRSHLTVACILGVILFVATVVFVRSKIVAPLDRSMTALANATAEAEAAAQNKGQLLARVAETNRDLEVEVAERRCMEHELRKLSVAVEQSPVSVVITDTEGTIEYVNPLFTRLTGYTQEEAVGQNPRILKSGTWPKKSYEALWKTILAGKTWRGEFENKKKNGELYWESASISPIRNQQGEITHFLAVKENITERKRREEDLQRAKLAAEAANETKSEFVANMSHEIRTPMTAILGFAENLLDSDQSESENRNCVRTIRRNCESLLGIINDILDISKIEAGRMEVNRTPCEPCAIIAEVSSLVRVQAETKGLSLHVEFDSAIPKTINTDPARLRQILINLVGNAIKFTETGSVRLVTRLVDNGDESCLQFDVIDTGPGIPDQERDRLFEPFVQADNSTTRKFGGTGLGLTISKRFAELLGGDITILTTELRVGTTFRASVATGSLDGVTMLEDPLSATVVADSAATIAQVSQTDLHGLRLLLAEDSPDSQRLISFVLKKAGADVTVEENGKLALDAALAARDKGDPFSVILMDMQMPVMDGYEATGRLRQEGYTGPIIALTAHAMTGDREKCINAGCDDYATKPIDRQKLVELILDHVRGGRLKLDTEPTETSRRSSLQGCRILVAEDNATNQVLLVGILKKAGAEITAVKDGKLALDAALAARDNGPGSPEFDVILMDIQMPVMGGDEATKLLREQGCTATIIAFTANAIEGYRQGCVECGFDDYIEKPINRAKLIETIRHHWVGAEAARAT